MDGIEPSNRNRDGRLSAPSDEMTPRRHDDTIDLGIRYCLGVSSPMALLIRRESDVRYVVTVPAIWTPAAKKIMHSAATSAGLDEQKDLLLALEPEAAAYTCRSLMSRERQVWRRFVSMRGVCMQGFGM